MVSQTLADDLHTPKNRTFLRRLYRVTKGTPRSVQKKLIFDASKKQVKLLCQIVRQVMTGGIPLREVHFPEVVKTKKLNFLKNNFANKEGYQKLLALTLREQKEALNKITCYHQLLFNIFREQTAA